MLVQCEVVFDALLGLVNLIDSTGTTVSSSPAGSIPVDTSAYFEIGVNIGTGTSGSLQVKVNTIPVQDGSASGINTQASGNANFSVLQFYTNKFLISDLYLTDNTGIGPWNSYLGPVNNQFQIPAGPGNTTMWQANAAPTNWQAAGDQTLTLATYVSSGADGDTDLYTLSALQGSIISVVASQILLAGQVAGSAARRVSPTLYSGGTIVSDAATLVSTSTVGFILGDLRTVNPNGGMPWTQATAQAVQTGPQLIS